MNTNNPDMKQQDREKLHWINEDFAVTDIQFRSLEDDFDETETTPARLIQRRLRALQAASSGGNTVGIIKLAKTSDAKELLDVDTTGNIVE